METVFLPHFHNLDWEQDYEEMNDEYDREQIDDTKYEDMSHTDALTILKNRTG